MKNRLIILKSEERAVLHVSEAGSALICRQAQHWSETSLIDLNPSDSVLLSFCREWFRKIQRLVTGFLRVVLLSCQIEKMA